MEPENDDILSELAAYLSANGGGDQSLALLTVEREKRLGRLIRQGNKEAREILINVNLRLVIIIAGRYQTWGVPMENLIEAGKLGLIHSVDKYDHTKGYRFTTYATHWIRQAVGRCVQERGSAEPCSLL